MHRLEGGGTCELVSYARPSACTAMPRGRAVKRIRRTAARLSTQTFIKFCGCVPTSCRDVLKLQALVVQASWLPGAVQGGQLWVRGTGGSLSHSPTFHSVSILLTNPLDSLETWDASANQLPYIPQSPHPSTPYILVQMCIISEGIWTSWYYSPNRLFSAMSAYLS